MSDLLINLAALRTEFNQGQSDLVKQFMPMVAHAISQISEPFVTESELQRIIYDTMQFQVPVGALRSFINRASNRRYGYITKNPDGTYSPNRAALANVGFGGRLREAKSHQTQLLNSFSEYCGKEFGVPIGQEEIERYFFEILFDIAPIVMRSLADPIKHKLSIPDDSENSEDKIRYRVYHFVAFCAINNNVELQYIEEFIYGAVMAESLFYSTPSESLHRMIDVKVFLDTPIILAAIGLADEAEIKATRELIDLLKILKARVRCFEDTKNEVHGIIFAVTKSKERGQQYKKRPGDVGDISDRRGLDLADLSALLNGLEEILSNNGIKIEDRPQVISGSTINIDESELAARIKQTASKQRWSNDPSFAFDRRLQHDIDCVRAIYQLRDGKAINSLERCKAIFVTSASVLVSVTSEFFSEHDEVLASAVPICIGSSVFTMLMWLKATDRKPLLTKDRLVANSIAALMPSSEVWDAFISNLRAMLSRGEIEQAQFDYISNAMETRTILMAETEGDIDSVTAGTAHDVREKVMARLVSGKDEEINLKNTEIDKLKTQIDDLKIVLSNTQQSQLDSSNRRKLLARKTVWHFFQIVITIPFIYLFIRECIKLYESDEKAGYITVAILGVVSILNVLGLFFIQPWKRKLRNTSDKLVDRIDQGT